jgi:hypothetical protein
MTALIAREIQKHGIGVELRSPASIDDDLGRISGSTIEVVTDPLEATIAAFTLCHLFGHMVQFTTVDRYRHVIDPVSEPPPISLNDEFWQSFYCYEREAFGYGACLLENAVPTDDHLRSLYANFMKVDFDHFRKYISSGNRVNRAEYRATLLHRYMSRPMVIHVEPLSISAVEWSNLASVKATIY